MQLLLPQILLTEKKLLWSPPIISCYSVENHRYYGIFFSLLNCSTTWRRIGWSNTVDLCGMCNCRSFHRQGLLFSLCPLQSGDIRCSRGIFCSQWLQLVPFCDVKTQRKSDVKIRKMSTLIGKVWCVIFLCLFLFGGGRFITSPPVGDNFGTHTRKSLTEVCILFL